MLCGRVDFLRRQEHNCPYARAPRLTDRDCERGGARDVRKVGDRKSVMVAESEIELLEPSANTEGGSGDGLCRPLPPAV